MTVDYADSRDGVRALLAAESMIASAALAIPDAEIVPDPWVSGVWAARDAQGFGWLVNVRDVGALEEVDLGGVWPPRVAGGRS